MSARSLARPSWTHVALAVALFAFQPVFADRATGIVCKDGSACPTFVDAPVSLVGMVGDRPHGLQAPDAGAGLAALVSIVAAFAIVAPWRAAAALRIRAASWLRPTRADLVVFGVACLALLPILAHFASGRAGGVGDMGPWGERAYSAASIVAVLVLPFWIVAWAAAYVGAASLGALALHARTSWLAPGTGVSDFRFEHLSDVGLVIVLLSSLSALYVASIVVARLAGRMRRTGAGATRTAEMQVALVPPE